MNYEYDDLSVTGTDLTRLAARGWELVTVLGPATMTPGQPFRALLRRDRTEIRVTAELPKRGPGRPRKEVTA
jgi:hypothetical protein